MIVPIFVKHTKLAIEKYSYKSSLSKTIRDQLFTLLSNWDYVLNVDTGAGAFFEKWTHKFSELSLLDSGLDPKELLSVKASFKADHFMLNKISKWEE